MSELNLISLGAGVQSSCLAIGMDRGIFPTANGKGVDGAIFADTGAESRATYAYLDWLEIVLSFPVYRVKEKEGLTKALENSVTMGDRVATIPFFTEGDGLVMRQCSLEYKIKPIQAKIRELLGLKKGQRVPKGVHVHQYIGISLDEIQRMKPSQLKWSTHHWPLIDARMKRYECLNWMDKHDLPEPPRSACVYCPYHSDHEWRLLRDKDPEGWNEAVRVDAMVRDKLPGMKKSVYIHRSLEPLDQVDLSTEEDRGQSTFFEAWNADCQGICGV